MVQAIEVLPEQKPAIRINAGSEAEFVDWNSSVWTADAHFAGGTTITIRRAGGPCVADAVRSGVVPHGPLGKNIRLHACRTAGLVHGASEVCGVVVAKAWPAADGHYGQRAVGPKSWDPAAAAGRSGMAADIRIDNITPDKESHIAIGLRATGQRRHPPGD